MKRNLFVLVFLLVLGKISAQTERYIYETTINPDSINLVEMKPPNGKLGENPPDMQNGQNSSQNFGTNFGNYNSSNPIEIK